jgi:PD-(D/E)XK nuclease superfamily
MSTSKNSKMNVLISNLSDEQKVGMENFIEKLNNPKANGLELSPSALKKLVDDPYGYFLTYVCEDFDKKETAAQKRGTLIHTLFLEPEKFDERYVIRKENLASPSDRELLLLNYIANLENCRSAVLKEYRKEILDYMILDNYYQNLKDDKEASGDDKRLAKIVTTANSEYFAHLVESAGKEIISKSQYDEAKLTVDVLNADPHSEKTKLLSDNEDVQNEIELKTFYEGFTLKCILDSLKISVSDKKVYITDLKSIGSTIESLVKWDFEKNKHFIQAAIGALAVENFIKNPELEKYVPNISKFEIVYSFLFIDSTKSVYNIRISSETMSTYKLMLSDLLTKNVKYHFENFDFSTRFDLTNNLLIL